MPDRCGGECVDTGSDPRHCGGCDMPCTGACDDGTCRIATGLALGHQHSCALLMDGSVACWGRNAQGQLGTGDRTPQYSPVIVDLARVVQLSAGLGHTCARRSADVYCWGDNDEGQVGNGAFDDQLSPTVVVDLGNEPLWIGVGEIHSCVVDGGEVWCWGANGSGELGFGMTSPSRNRPLRVTGITSAATAVEGGRAFTVALLSGSTLRSWGTNALGQLGNDSTTISPSPVSVTGLIGIRQVSAGDGHACALETGGAIRCWGRNESGQLGDGTFEPRRVGSLTVSGLTNAVELTTGVSHSCARTATGEIYCWGNNGGGQLGDGTMMNRNEPILIEGIDDAIAVAAGATHTCVIREGGAVWCWGMNTEGQLGVGDTDPRVGIHPVVW